MRKQKAKSAREIKEETVKTLSEKIGRAKTLAFVDYRGLNVLQINAIRKKVKEAGGEMLVTKNTLITQALEISNFILHPSDFIGPTATVFAYDDEISPIKIIAESAKTFNLPKFKAGFFNKSYLDANAIENLAKIPSRQQLNTNLVGSLASPLYGIVSVLQANIRNLISTLDQATKKSASSKLASSV